MCISQDSPLFEQAMERLIAAGLAIAEGQTDPQLFLEQAEAFWIVRDLPATVAALDRALTASPPLADDIVARVFASRAICYLQMNRPDEALADATRALELAPIGHAAALRGMTHLSRGDRTAALADAETGMALDPDDWEARAWRGMIYAETGRHQQAIADFTAVLDSGLCSRYASELYLGRARCRLAQGDATAAVEDCRQAITEDYHEQAHWPYIVRARVLRAHEAYLVRAEARLHLGEVALALGDCYFAASITPDDSAVYALRARVYHTAGNIGEAIRDSLRADYLRRKAQVQPGIHETLPLIRNGSVPAEARHV